MEARLSEQLHGLMLREEEILAELGSQETAADSQKTMALMKEQGKLAPVTGTYRRYLEAEKQRDEAEELMKTEKDEELISLMKEERASALLQMEELHKELRILLLPKDENDDKNVFVEIRAGAGGDEAALFAAELFRMYRNYAESRRWKTSFVSANENGIGGMKEVVFQVMGDGAYSRLKYESGVHRVQRVPETESGGRIHTSTCTVAIMPEADEVEIEIDPKEYRFDVFRSSGHGGQSVNTTDSAVRLTHEPTGIVISCQDEKSQLKNKEKALRVLRAKLYELKLEEMQKEASDERKSQIGTGDRSEKIRTYNFPQGRVTDHRIKKTIYKIQEFLDGDLDMILNALIEADQAAKLLLQEEDK